MVHDEEMRDSVSISIELPKEALESLESLAASEGKVCPSTHSRLYSGTAG